MNRPQILCTLLLLALAGTASAASSDTGLAHFITRRGATLYDGDKPFRFMGANMPGLVLPYDWTLFLPERMHLPTAWEQEDAFKTLDQMGFGVVRTWNLPMRRPDEPPQSWHYVLGPGEFNEDAFKVLDQLFALANRYRVRVIFDFSAEYGSYLGGIATYAQHRGRKAADFYTDAQLKEDYKATLRHVLTRRNTITGVPYAEDKAVLAWQFGNEMHGAPDAWLSEMAAYIKQLAPNHLVAETRHRPGQPLLIDPNIDLLTRHLYANYKGVDGGWAGAMRDEMEKLGGQRPMFVGEFGPYIDGKMFTPENVVEKTAEFVKAVEQDPAIAGALLWSMYFHHQAGGYYWHQIMTYPAVWSYHWPGFPSAEAQREKGLLDLLRTAAFRIQGKPVPPLPVPDAPELLPFSDVPLFSWRGSAGATGYDIERAAQSTGPWQTIATNVSDADIAYRPLFSDTTARSGESWVYRVKARNAAGISAASNTIGPVAVRRVCLADELQDLTKTHATCGRLTLDNDYNAVYAEYLFRAVGKAGDWIDYRVPGRISSVKVTSFRSDKGGDLKLLASTDGIEFKPVAVEPRARRLPPVPSGAAGGRQRNLVEHEAAITTPARYLRVEWTGPAELDRVEIFHDGHAEPTAPTSAPERASP